MEASVSEHTIMIVILGWVVLNVSFTGYLAYKVFRRSEQIEGIVAVTYLEARRALSQYRP
jgi:hypothetical protein